jgi:predicted permease
MTDPQGPVPGERIFRWLTRLYPRDFRRRYAADLIETFRRDRTRPTFAGPAGRLRFWRFVIRDLVSTALSERRQTALARRADGGWAAAARDAAMTSLARDVRHSVRSLAKEPVFSLVAILSLALGIGVNTAIFSALHSLLLRPLAIRDLDRSVFVYDASPERADLGTTFPGYRRIRERTEIFSGVMAFAGARPLFLTDGARRDQVYAELVAGDFFSLADITLRAGRPPGPEIDRADAPPSAAVLSHAFWRRRLDADPAIVGRTIDLNGQPFAVMAVAAEGFIGLDAEVSVDLWIPMTTWAHLVSEPGRLSGDEHWIRTIARLQDGVTMEQAAAAVNAGADRPPELTGERTLVRPARQRSIAPPTDALAAGAAAFAVGLFVLLLACTNVMNLLLARAAGRQREMSVRLALGSSRARLVRLGLVDCAVLCVSAGALGLVVAWWLLDLVVAFEPPTMIGQSESGTLPIDFRLDLRMFAFALGLSTLVAAIVGLMSGLYGSRPGMTRAIGSDRTTDRRFAPGFNARSAVIALQMALSLILLVPCALLVRAWVDASRLDPGFSADRVMLLPISSDQAGVRVGKPEGFNQQLAERVSALPGVASATIMDPVPLWFGSNAAYFAVEGRPAGEEPLRIEFARIGPDYFDTMQMPLVRGRDFSRDDTAAAPPVAILNETLARRLWPDGDALGQRLRRRDAVLEVVGIAKDAKYLNLAEAPRPWLYLSLAQDPTDNPTLSLAVRTTGDPMQLRAPIEREVKALVPGWPAFHLRTLDEGVEMQRSLPRLGATLLGALGAFGALLAAVGIYGVMTYVVLQRRQEIGIRLALGAPGPSVVGLMIRQGMSVCVAGAALGLVVSLIAMQALRGVLAGIRAADPVAYAAVSSLLLGIALVACYLPAWHATKVNAVDVLRRE